MNLLKESWNRKKKSFWSSLANVLYISVFTLQPDGESTESLPVSNAWLIGRFQGRSATRQSLQNIPFIVPFPLQGRQMGEHKIKKKKKILQEKKYQFFLVESSFPVDF